MSCWRTDELASARLNLFSPEALRDRLGSRLRLLRGGARDLLARQQTLRATIEWSYRLLEPGERRLFELLSVLSGAGFEAVEVVTAELDRLTELEVDILDGLTSLVDKSLLRRADAERVGHGWQCWRPSVSTRPKRWTMRPSSALPPVEPTPPNF